MKVYSSNYRRKNNIAKYSDQNNNLDHLRLPTPVSFISVQFSNINATQTMAKVLYPFHDGTHPSLSINLEEGWCKLHACGEGGAGIVKFHMSGFNLNYKQTIKELEMFYAD